MNKLKYNLIGILVTIAQFTNAQNSCNCRELQVSGGENITEFIDILLNDPEVRICFDKVEPLNINATQRFINLLYDGNFTLSGNQQLSIRNYMRLNVTGTITLEDQASIIGENYGGSKINQLTPGQTTISVIPPIPPETDGTVIRDIQFTAENRDPATGEFLPNANRNIDNVIGIELVDNSAEGDPAPDTNAEITSVSFDGLRIGIIVDTDGNTFSDLEFFDVATWGNCIPVANKKMKELITILIMLVKDGKVTNC